MEHKKKKRVFIFEMGICISTVSSEIHDTEAVQDNAVFIDETNDKTKRNGSVHSRAGSKGLNQDAAILYQVCRDLNIIESIEVVFVRTA